MKKLQLSIVTFRRAFCEKAFILTTFIIVHITILLNLASVVNQIH